MSEKVNICVIGGGRSGAPLIDDFIKRPFVNLIGVADINTESPGARIAKENGVYFTNDAMDIAKLGDKVDIVIEVSGDRSVKPQLKEYYTETGNKKTIIAHDIIARLLISLASNSDELASSFHPNDVGIG